MASALVDRKVGVTEENDTIQHASPNVDHIHHISNDTRFSDEETPQAKIVIPETPSPSMPKKQQQSRKNGSFNIAESIFCSLPSSKSKVSSPNKLAKVKKRHQDNKMHKSSLAKSNSLPAISDKSVKSSSDSALSSFKINSLHASKTTPASSSADSVNRQPLNSLETSTAKQSRTEVDQSSSGSDDDIPLLQRVKKKMEKKNGTLSAPSTRNVTKGSTNTQAEHNVVTSGKHSAEQTQLHVCKRDVLASKRVLNSVAIPHGKRAKVSSESPKKDNCNVRTSSKEVSRTDADQIAIHSGRSSQNSTDRNSRVLGHKQFEKQKKQLSLIQGDNPDKYRSKTEAYHDQKSCAMEATDTVSERGPSVVRAKTKKKPSPRNTTRNHKNNILQKQIMELFGSETEFSESDVVPKEKKTSVANASEKNLHSPKVSGTLKKDGSRKSNLIVSHDSSDTELDVRNLHSPPSGMRKKDTSRKSNFILSNDSSDVEPDVRTLHSPAGSCNKKKDTTKRSNLSVFDDSSDTEPDVRTLHSPAGSCMRKRDISKKSNLIVSDDSSDTELNVRNLHSPTASCMRKKDLSKKSNLIVSDDSSNTEPDVSLLVTKPKGKRISKKVKQKIKKGDARQLMIDSSSDDSDVEMVSASETPEKSPVFQRRAESHVFNRTRSELNRRAIDRRIGLPAANDTLVAKGEVSRTSKRRKKNNRTEKHEDTDDDIVTLDEVEEVDLPRRHMRITTQRSFELVSRLSGAVGNRLHRGAERTHGRSELGTPINLEHFRLSTSSANIEQPGPSFQQNYPKRNRRRRNQDSGSNEERQGQSRQNPNIRTGGLSSPERRERQRQLEADEQLARDLASGRVHTPRSSGKKKKADNRSKQMAEDEALARELASGRISTPAGQVASHQIDEDEALARQLQEQFNAEAMQAHTAEPDMTVTSTSTTHLPGHYPFAFQYEMGMSSSPAYPRVDMSGGLGPVIFGAFEDSPPRGRRQGRGRGRGRGRTRGSRRGRSAGGIHIQFFPMDTTLDDDYESLWELADRVGPAVQQGLRPEVLSLLPTFRYKPDKAEQEEGEENGGKNCTICMMDYEEGDNLRRLPCFHDYHTTCIDRWLADNSACPVCQTKVTVDDQSIG